MEKKTDGKLGRARTSWSSWGCIETASSYCPWPWWFGSCRSFYPCHVAKHTSGLGVRAAIGGPRERWVVSVLSVAPCQQSKPTDKGQCVTAPKWLPLHFYPPDPAQGVLLCSILTNIQWRECQLSKWHTAKPPRWILVISWSNSFHSLTGRKISLGYLSFSGVFEIYQWCNSEAHKWAERSGWSSTIISFFGKMPEQPRMWIQMGMEVIQPIPVLYWWKAKAQ